MKKVLAMVAFVMLSVIVYAFNDKPDANQGKKEVTGNGEVVVMDKEMFLKASSIMKNQKSGNTKVTNLPSSTYMQTGVVLVARQPQS